MVGFILFTARTIIASFYLSLTNYAPGKSPQWVGFNNYISLFNDMIFLKSLQVTSYYTLLSVPLGITLLVAAGGAAESEGAFMGVFRTLYYLPALLAGSVAVALLFSWLLNPQFGIINFIIRFFVGPQELAPVWHYAGPRWLQDLELGYSFLYHVLRCGALAPVC